MRYVLTMGCVVWVRVLVVLALAVGRMAGADEDTEVTPSPYLCSSWVQLFALQEQLAALKEQRATLARYVEMKALRRQIAAVRYELTARQPANARSAYAHHTAPWRSNVKKGEPVPLDLSEELTDRIEFRLSRHHQIEEPERLMEALNLRVNLSKQFRTVGNTYLADLNAQGFETRDARFIVAEQLARYREYSRRYPVHTRNDLEELSALLKSPAVVAFAADTLTPVDVDPANPGKAICTENVVRLLAERRLGRSYEEVRKALMADAFAAGHENKSLLDVITHYLKATDPLYYVIDLVSAQQFAYGD